MSKTLLIGTIVAVVGLFALAGVLLWQMSQPQAGLGPSSPTPTPTPSPQSQEQSPINNQQSTIDTSGWQTYRNEEYGFEVKYPPSWKLTIEKETGSDIKISFNTGIPSSILEESIVVGKTDMSFEEWEQELYAAPEEFVWSIREVELDGQRATRARFRGAYGNFEAIGTVYEGKLYSINTGGVMFENNTISTFRFVE